MLSQNALSILKVQIRVLASRQNMGRTYSTPRILIEGMKNPRGSREGVARRSAEAPAGKRQKPSLVGGVPTTMRLFVQTLTSRTPRTLFKGIEPLYCSCEAYFYFITECKNSPISRQACLLSFKKGVRY